VWQVVDAGATPRATVVMAQAGGRLVAEVTHAGALLGHLDGQRRIVAHTAGLFARVRCDPLHGVTRAG
jgi:hypothetical protein